MHIDWRVRPDGKEGGAVDSIQTVDTSLVLYSGYVVGIFRIHFNYLYIAFGIVGHF